MDTTTTEKHGEQRPLGAQIWRQKCTQQASSTDGGRKQQEVDKWSLANFPPRATRSKSRHVMHISRYEYQLPKYTVTAADAESDMLHRSSFHGMI